LVFLYLRSSNGSFLCIPETFSLRAPGAWTKILRRDIRLHSMSGGGIALRPSKNRKQFDDSLMSLFRRSTSTSQFSSLFPNGCGHRQALDERDSKLKRSRRPQPSAAFRSLGLANGLVQSVRWVGANSNGRQVSVRSMPISGLSVLTSPSRLSQAGPTRCIMCLGKKTLAYEDRIQSFYSVAGLGKHFHSGTSPSLQGR
jgi:hypothetical protein